MSNDYTPTTDEVRTGYARDRWLQVANTGPAFEQWRAEFDRWLAEHDAEVRAAAYEKVAADENHVGGWAIAGPLRDLAKVERGQMTEADLVKTWRGDD